MRFTLDKVMKIVSLLGANGAGASNSSNSSTTSGSWFTEILAWLGNAIVKVATVVWGWLISIFYFVIRFCLNIIDVLQMFIQKLVGIDIYNQKGGLSAVKDIKDTDIIIRFITNDTVLKTFRTILILGLILLIIFSILAIVKQNYTAAITDGADGVKSPRNVLKNIGKACFLCLLVPFLLVFGILGSNAVLASICNSIKGDNDLTIGGLIYTASAYEANKYRQYASDNIRVPIFVNGATEIVNPGDYTTDQDMQVLFYKLVNGTIYIEAINESEYFKSKKESYDSWVNLVSVEDAGLDLSEISGSAVIRDKFKPDFEEFYQEFFTFANKTWPLAEFGVFNAVIKSVYNSNWVRNKTLSDLSYDFDSTYTTQKEVLFQSRDGKDIKANIIVNSSSYQNAEEFATIELEYYVMADLIDFAIEQNKVLYYVNMSNGSIMWSDIVLDENKPDDKINIEEYNNQFLIVKGDRDSNGSYRYDGCAYSTANGTTASSVASTNFPGMDIVSESAIAVRYYNGVNRLYWSEEGATSENNGATYIICTKTTDGKYIPVTQSTTKFKSNFLASDYYGPIVARGVFQADGLIPDDYCKPTAIVEQIVDDNGNELKNIDKTSPYAISDTYQEDSNVLTAMSSFCGKLSNFTGGVGFALLEKLYTAENAIIQAAKESLLENMASKLNEDDTETVDGKVKRKENLLINPNIDGFRYIYKSGATSPSSVEFYDKNGRKISKGSAYVNGEDTTIELTDKSQFNKKGYVVLQKTCWSNTIIPWYYNDSITLNKALSELLNKFKEDNTQYTFLVLEYTYDNIQFSLDLAGQEGSETLRMLLNFNITKIIQLDNFDQKKEGTSGEFITTDFYGLRDEDSIAVQRKVNLVISSGEIYYSNGDKFFGREDAIKYYTNFANDYLKDTLTTSLVGEIQKKIQVQKFKELMEGFGVDTSEESVGVDFAAMDFRVGVASLIKQYTKSYYSINEVVSKDGEGNEIIDGTISYYDQNNQKIQDASIKYTSKVYRTNYKISTRAAVVCGPSGGTASGAISYVALMDAAKDVTDNPIYNGYEIKVSGYDEFNSRAVYYYDITYDYSFWEYFDKDGNTVAVLGLTIDGVTLTEKTNNDGSGQKPNALVIKNNSIYCGALGSTITNMSGIKNYMAHDAELGASGTDISLRYDNIIKPDAAATNTDQKFSSDMKGHSTLKLLNSITTNIKSQSEYNNIYTYFVRGNFNWTMLLDFCISLPVLNLSSLKFTFRFRMGTSYNYSERVVYRLQGGMFYLDYNFRNATGIDIKNLFTMSKINPFILVFSTVLVMSILWTTVWGLINRIYHIVLLFILLPAVCSTIPIDDGARFGKWKDNTIQQVLSAYSVLITLNIYFVLVPIVKDVTSNLITSGDLPTTITGLFSMIKFGAQNIGSVLNSIGTKFTGNVSLSNLPLLLDSELTMAEQTVLNHVNTIVYIMFFLVLTTMLKNGKSLIETVLDLGKLDDGVLDNVKSNINSVKSSPVVKAPEAMIKGSAKLIAGGARAVATGGASLAGDASRILGSMMNNRRRSGGATPPSSATMSGPSSPISGPSGGPTGPTSSSTGGGTPIYGGPEASPQAGVAMGEPIGMGPETVENTTDGAERRAYTRPEATMGSEPTADNFVGPVPLSEEDQAKIDEIDNKISQVDTFRQESVDEILSQKPDFADKTYGEYLQEVQNAENDKKQAHEDASILDQERVKAQNEGRFEGEFKDNWEKLNSEAIQRGEDALDKLSKLKQEEWAYGEQKEALNKVDEIANSELDRLTEERDKITGDATAKAVESAKERMKEEASSMTAENATTSETATTAETAESVSDPDLEEEMNNLNAKANQLDEMLNKPGRGSELDYFNSHLTGDLDEDIKFAKEQQKELQEKIDKLNSTKPEGESMTNKEYWNKMDELGSKISDARKNMILDGKARNLTAEEQEYKDLSSKRVKYADTQIDVNNLSLTQQKAKIKELSARRQIASNDFNDNHEKLEKVMNRTITQDGVDYKFGDVVSEGEKLDKKRKALGNRQARLELEKEAAEKAGTFSGETKAKWEAEYSKVASQLADVEKGKKANNKAFAAFGNDTISEAEKYAKNASSLKKDMDDAYKAEKAELSSVETVQDAQRNGHFKESSNTKIASAIRDEQENVKNAKEHVKAKAEAREEKRRVDAMSPEQRARYEAEKKAEQERLEAERKRAEAEQRQRDSGIFNMSAGVSGGTSTQSSGYSEISTEQLERQLNAAKNDINAQRFVSEEDRQSAIKSMEEELKARAGAGATTTSSGTASAQSSASSSSASSTTTSSSSSSSQRTTTTKTKPKSNTFKKVVKGTGLAALAVTAPMPATIAVLGGVMVKKAVTSKVAKSTYDKIKNSNFAKKTAQITAKPRAFVKNHKADIVMGAFVPGVLAGKYAVKGVKQGAKFVAKQWNAEPKPPKEKPARQKTEKVAKDTARAEVDKNIDEIIKKSNEEAKKTAEQTAKKVAKETTEKAVKAEQAKPKSATKSEIKSTTKTEPKEKSRKDLEVEKLKSELAKINKEIREIKADTEGKKYGDAGERNKRLTSLQHQKAGIVSKLK